MVYIATRKQKGKYDIKLIYSLVRVANYILFQCMVKILDKLSLKQLVCEEKYHFG